MKSLVLPVCLFLSTLCGASQDGDSPRRRAVSALMEFLDDETRSTAGFIEGHLGAKLVERVGAKTLASGLADLRAAVRGAEVAEYFPDGAHGACLVYFKPPGTELELLLRLAPTPPHRITDLWIEGCEHLDPQAEVEPLPPPLTWDNLAERMAAEEQAGFSGVLLLVKDGEQVMNGAWGYANREKQIRTTPETIFAIGSTPIDFTKAAILLLSEQELLDLDQPITDFFNDVPADKTATTIRHLMTGRSGLQDFHGLPGDADPDHHWIDREEAVRRILAQTLLFAPGRGNEHSHSAWGLLAAIVEIASDGSYQDFTREHLLGPAGMQDTGFNGDPIPEQRCAVGYGYISDGEVNAPPFWGRTSWLVMGSGGMVSTSGDMLRWMRAMRAGKILSQKSQARYWSPPGAILAGGDMFGFEIIYSEGPDKLVFLLGNSADASTRRRFNRLGKELVKLR